MRAAVVGTNWGQVHRAALTEAGVEVVALVGRGYPLSALADMQLDLIGVATPTETHTAVIDALPDVPVLCEKPAIGLSSWGSPRPPRASPIWVNYAFSFLDGAVRAAAELPRLGVLESVAVRSTFDLPGAALPIEVMFTEVAVHPWSWVVSLLRSSAGASASNGPGLQDAGCSVSVRTSHRLRLHTSATGVAVEVECQRLPGRQGITHEVSFRGERGHLRVSGHFNIGSDWTFPPPHIRWGDGRMEVLGRAEVGPPDPWYRANAQAVAAVVCAVGGGGLDSRLFSWTSALGLDRCIRHALGIDP